MLSWTIRLVAGVAILGLLLHFGWLDFGIFTKAIDHPGLLLLSAVFLFSTVPLAALRWWWLLRGLRYPMGFFWSLRAIFISQFLSTFLPGAYGGDVVRVALAYRAAKSGLSRLTLSVIVDRLSGLVGLLLLGVAALWNLPLPVREHAYFPLAVGGGVLLIAVIVMVAWVDRVAVLLERMPMIGAKIANAAREVGAALAIYIRRWPVLLLALILSVVQFVLVLAALAVLGAAMTFTSLPASGYIVAGVWSLIMNAIPLTPGGIGIGEASFGHIAGLFETGASGASYATVFLALRVLTILIATLGIIPYLPRSVELRHDVASVSKSIR